MSCTATVYEDDTRWLFFHITQYKIWAWWTLGNLANSYTSFWSESVRSRHEFLLCCSLIPKAHTRPFLHPCLSQHLFLSTTDRGMDIIWGWCTRPGRCFQGGRLWWGKCPPQNFLAIFGTVFPYLAPHAIMSYFSVVAYELSSRVLEMCTSVSSKSPSRVWDWAGASLQERKKNYSL